METIAYALAAAAGAIHMYIFYLESVAWRRPSAHRIFGVKNLDDAELLAPVFFNLGFYNLFLALGAAAGALLGFAGSSTGEVLVLYTMSFMLASALVLVGSQPAMMRGALVQGLLPAMAVALLLVA